MTAKKNAFALHSFNIHGDPPEPVAARQVILGMDRTQFESFEQAGMVREATDAEVAREKGDSTASSTSAARKRKRSGSPRRTAAAAPAAPAPAPASPAPAPDAPTT